MLHRASNRPGADERHGLAIGEDANVVGDGREGLGEFTRHLAGTERRVLATEEVSQDGSSQRVSQGVQHVLLGVVVFCHRRLLFGSLGTRLFSAQYLERFKSINRIREIKYRIFPVDRLRRTRNHPAVNDLGDSVAKGFGAKLRKAREDAGLTQEELAYLGGISRTVISPLELGQHAPRLDTLIKLAGALGVEPCQLIADVRWTPPPAQGPSGGSFRDL